MNDTVTFADVRQARDRLRAGGLVETPCPDSIPISELCGCQIFCKLDYLQRTGSFKERGARNALLLLPTDQRAQGVIAASAGNHALGLAYHGQLLGVPVTVVMPRFAPLIKVATCRRLGATVVLHGETLAAAKAHAEELTVAQGLTYIHGYDDPAIIAGQGTLALEVLEQVPDAAAIIVPAGGGGLLAGVTLGVTAAKRPVQVIGVEPATMPSLTAALAAGQPVDVPATSTLADGLAVSRVGARSFGVLRDRVTRVVTVSEHSIALAVLRLLELEKSVVEGAGAAGLAAFLEGQLPELAGKKVVLLLTGGNIDPTILPRIIENGLVADGRLCRFAAKISDRPGSLARLTQLLATTGVSVRDIEHDRMFSGPDVTAVRVICTVETNDHAHVQRLRAALQEAGIAVTFATPDAQSSAAK
ncbi:MAG: L-threonine ammonia-lyase [Verrucomicrobiae bacterium]|nr:L-threonine ammonia-lyase [Verrucomicrobiae bacterium]